MEKNKTEQNAPLPRFPGYGWSNASTPSAVPGPTTASGADCPPLAVSMPMEGAVMYQKVIDNSSVRYRHDPRDRYSLRNHISWGLFVVLLLLLVSGPRLWVRHSGYRQAQLAESIDDLIAVREHLKVEKGRLEDLRRVAVLAERMGLRETGDDSYVFPDQHPREPVTATTVAQLFEPRQ